MTKYRNKRTEAHGIIFDSKKEAQRYTDLCTLQCGGIISHLTCQPKFVLQEAFRRNGEAIRAITYIGDFQYRENGRIIVEDTKGMQTEVFKIKRKLFLAKYPDIELRIV